MRQPVVMKAQRVPGAAVAIHGNFKGIASAQPEVILVGSQVARVDHGSIPGQWQHFARTPVAADQLLHTGVMEIGL